MGALLIGRIVLVMLAAPAATASPNGPGPVSVATVLVRHAWDDREAECRPENGPPSARRFSCRLPNEWAEVDVRVTANGRHLVVLGGSAGRLPRARHRSSSYFGAFELSGLLCAPLGDRTFLCDGSFDESGYEAGVQVRFGRTRYGSLVESCRFTTSKVQRRFGSRWACQHLTWDVNQPTSTLAGLAEMSRQVRREGR